MKVQKEKKEKKERGDVDEDGDIEMEEASAPASEIKKRKVKGTEIAKIKSKRSVDTSSDEPALKKKKTAASDEKDLFFLKPEDKPVSTKKVKTVNAKEAAPKKEQATSAAAVATAVLPQKPKTKAETGVVGVVDKTKKLLKAGSKKTTDIVAALENESKKQEVNDSGTGLDVGGWD